MSSVPGARVRAVMRRRLLARTAAFAVAAMALTAGCSGAGDTTGEPTGPCGDTAQNAAAITLCASAGTVRAGERFETWVVGGAQTGRGLDAALEVWRDGMWHRAATLVAPIPHLGGEPTHALGETPIGIRSIGIGSATRLRHAVPPVAFGRYRLTQDVSAEGTAEPARTFVHRELVVIP